MIGLRLLRKSQIRHWRRFSLCSIFNQSIDTQPLTEALTVPPPSSVDTPISPKIEKLINEISNLTLLEVCELSGGLKKKLNLPDAPVVPLGVKTAADEDEAPKKVKTSFTVKLMKFNENQKVALIKEVKALVEGMNLVQAKKFVEGSPAIVKADVSKEEADKLKEALSKVGATIEID